ncbi:hypothetical protein ACFL4V_01935 [Candidatus Latescibacterota bacterium]
MNILADMKMYGRFAWGLRGFLRHTITLEEAKAIVRQRMSEREANFLRLVERGIFGYPRSPYLPLLKLAGCELGDIRNMVKDRGLEDTLHSLREAGVYVTFEEFKGREPIVREGKVIPVKHHDFDNPYLSHCYQVESGGTTGAGTRVATDLEHLADRAPNLMLAYDAHGLLGVPIAVWRGILPDGSGINGILRDVCIGNVPRKWFTPIVSRDFRPTLKYRLANQYIVSIGRLLGIPIPWPEPVSLDKAVVVARWAAETLRVERACSIRTSPSLALRVCLAAREEGLDLTGAVFSCGGEPLTPAKVREISRTGARCVSSYYFAEVGPVGMSCTRPADCNDQHFFKDRLALIQHPRQVSGSEITVQTFYFTTLLPTATKLMLNVEIDDYGVIENRSCGCPLEDYGFTEHIRHIRSFSKLTGEGVTLVGSEMIRILEEVLPAHFGGSPLDYQLFEEEDDAGFTKLSLLVSPKIKISDETMVINTVLEALGKSSVSADLARALWSQAETFRIKRMEPVWTARGKLMPLHLGKNLYHSTDQGEEEKSVPKP